MFLFKPGNSVPFTSPRPHLHYSMFLFKPEIRPVKYESEEFTLQYVSI